MAYFGRPRLEHLCRRVFPRRRTAGHLELGWTDPIVAHRERRGGDAAAYGSLGWRARPSLHERQSNAACRRRCRLRPRLACGDWPGDAYLSATLAATTGHGVARRDQPAVRCPERARRPAGDFIANARGD